MSATTQPINDQPRNRFMQNIAPLFTIALASATTVGIKYTMIPTIIIKTISDEPSIFSSILADFPLSYCINNLFAKRAVPRMANRFYDHNIIIADFPLKVNSKLQNTV